MSVNLEHSPEYGVDLCVMSGAVSVDETINAFAGADEKANWLVVFSENVDLSGVDVARFSAMRRAFNEGEPRGDELRLSALVNLSEPNELFVRFWAHYASAGAPRSRMRRMFSTFEAACQWLGLPSAASPALAAAAAEMVEAKAETGSGEAETAEDRRKIIKAASGLFRTRGFEALTVAEIMDAAGVAREAFEACFESKDDLIVHALVDALSDLPVPEKTWAKFTAAYLSPRHRDNIAGGCALAALASDSIRQSPAARTAMTVALNWQIERLSRNAPGGDAAARRRAAVRAWSAMVGAMILARASKDQELAQEVLDETHSWITDPSVAAVGAAGSSSPEIQPRP